MWAIAVEELRKCYGSVKAVDGISFQVFPGEIFGLLGPNGAGKTTTVETIIGLVRRDQGQVSVLGLDPLAEPLLVKSRIGVQLQMAHFFPRLTVLETIRLFGSFYPKRRSEEEVLSLTGLHEKAQTLVDKLSGGQLKRLSVGLALVGDVEVIFLDEPTSGLDPQSRRSLWEVILTLRKEGKTILLTTHYLDEAEKLCDRVAIIDQGKIIALGKPRDLITEHFEEKAVEIPLAGVREQSVLTALASITRLSADSEKITMYTLDLARVFADLGRLSERGQLLLHDIVVREATLEDVFLKLTGRRIRD
ncbi:MAG: ABC transporter ATP-binding protein [Candidatus Caldatribacteriaceae bacterium]